MHQIIGEEITLAIDVAHGARISSLQWRGLEFVVPMREDPMSWGWFGMVPWAGRIGYGKIKDADGRDFQLPTQWDPPHAEHGFGFHSRWNLIESNIFELAMPLPYSPAFARQSFELSTNTLVWKLEYFDNGCTLPAWVGFHPWFPRSIGSADDLELIFNADRALERGSNYLPTGKYIPVPDGEWDDAFTGVVQNPIIRWGTTAQIEIESQVPWWVVYNEDPLGICVEPQTAPPDAANLGIVGAKTVEAKFIFS